MTGSAETLGPFSSNLTIFEIGCIHLTVWIIHWMPLIFLFQPIWRPWSSLSGSHFLAAWRIFKSTTFPSLSLKLWKSRGLWVWMAVPTTDSNQWHSEEIAFTFKSTDCRRTSLSLLKVILDLRHGAGGFNSKSNFELRPHITIILVFRATYVFYIKIPFLDNEQIVICFWLYHFSLKMKCLLKNIIFHLLKINIF